MQNTNPAEGAKAAAEASQASLDAASDVSRQVFSAWAAGMEASLRATFEAQNAALQASISVLESTSGTGRDAMKQWSDLARQAQQAALDAFRSNVGAAEQAAERARPKRQG